jgi:hypothetical protein
MEIGGNAGVRGCAWQWDKVGARRRAPRNFPSSRKNTRLLSAPNPITMKNPKWLRFGSLALMLSAAALRAQSIQIVASDASGRVGEALTVAAQVTGATVSSIQFSFQNPAGVRNLSLNTAFNSILGGQGRVNWVADSEGDVFITASATVGAQTITSGPHKVTISGKALTLVTKTLNVVAGTDYTVAANATAKIDGSLVYFWLRRSDGVLSYEGQVQISGGQATRSIRPSFTGATVVVAEVSDRGFTRVAGDDAPPAPALPVRLINIATRGQLETASGTMTAGFVVAGSTAQRVVIRAAGPALGALGVPGTLANPRLRVFRGADVIATNDDWSADATDAAQLRALFTSVGAFAFPDGSRDAALVMNLAPGAYTAQVTSVDGGTGALIVEAYTVN